MTSDITSDEQPGRVSVKVDLRSANLTPAAYANRTLVQVSEDEYVISFFNIVPPAMAGTIEEQLDHAKSLTAIAATCVARIQVTPKHLDGLIKALQDAKVGLDAST